jgi:uncharacterized repeat protein (TIGR03806 family)
MHVEEPYPQKLSEWRLFRANQPALVPNDRVLPYDLNTPLFSDYASKYRFVWMPAGTSAKYSQDETFEFPVGTLFAKTFAFPLNGPNAPEKLIETRLLVRAKTGWVALPYIWDTAQRDAALQLVPDPVPIRYTEASGQTRDFTYFIPNVNECKQCHEHNKVLEPIGPKARNLNKDYPYAGGTANQLARWTRVGYLQGAPDPAAAPKAAKWDDPTSGTLDARARAYLDNNCAHCHQPAGSAGYSGLDLRITQADDRKLGSYKIPTSAGRVGNLKFDVLPGRPDESILLARMEATKPKIMMPQIGRSVVHAEGVALIREWIASLHDPALAKVPRSTGTP